MDLGLSVLVKDKKPTNLEFIYYIFWERGQLQVLERLPLPLIFSIMNTHVYMKEEEVKAMKKGRK